VRAHLERRAVVRVPEHLRDDRELLARGQEQRRAGTPEVVKADTPNASAGRCPFERTFIALSERFMRGARRGRY
jgi:hypothetical protein